MANEIVDRRRSAWSDANRRATGTGKRIGVGIRLMRGLANWSLAACAGVLLCAGQARADGCFVAPTANVKITIPDQEALIHYRDGVETLVIESRFTGEGDRFAWIVPLPSEPKIVPVTTGVFPTLRLQSQPRVIHYVPPFYLVVVAWTIPIVCIVVRQYKLLVAYSLAVSLWSVLLPSLGVAGDAAVAGASDAGPVRVHSRQIVGSYEVATVSSEHPDALLKWLGDNGFAATERTQAAIGRYAAEGWVFAAIKLHKDTTSGGVSAPHPLAFTFKTERAVYPLRLTGTHDGPCTIDLYVFGSQRASLAGFKVELCRAVWFGEPASTGDTWWGSRGEYAGKLPIGHAAIKELVRDGEIATKLSASLTSDQMAQDAWLNWEPFQPFERVIYSRVGVIRTLLNPVVILLCIVSVILAFAWRLRRLSKEALTRTAGRVTVATLAVAAVAYGVWPKQAVRVTTMPGYVSELYHIRVGDLLESRLYETAEAPTVEWARSGINTLRRDPQLAWLLQPHGENVLTGESIIEEDSPGNYGLRVGKKGLEYLWYDGWGGEHVVVLEARSQHRGPASQPATSATAD